MSPLYAGDSLNYLAVRLRAGESWTYQPAVNHTVGWLSLSSGRVRLPESVEAGELAIFVSSNAPIDLAADADAELMIGSAMPHPHDLALGNYSLHTSPASPLLL